MSNTTREKRCGKCEVAKPLHAFGPKQNHGDGYQSICRDCRNRTRRRYTVDVAEKRCSICKLIKPADQFYRVPTNKHGLDSGCKDCQCTSTRVRYEKAGGRVWVDRTATPENKRSRHMMRKYDITPEEYDRILLSQNGKCICGATGDINTHGVLYVDHDHETGKVRGLLCRNCNLAIGFGKDDPERLLALAAYLIATRIENGTTTLEPSELNRIAKRSAASLTRLVRLYEADRLAG